MLGGPFRLTLLRDHQRREGDRVPRQLVGLLEFQFCPVERRPGDGAGQESCRAWRGVQGVSFSLPSPSVWARFSASSSLWMAARYFVSTSASSAVSFGSAWRCSSVRSPAVAMARSSVRHFAYILSWCFCDSNIVFNPFG